MSQPFGISCRGGLNTNLNQLEMLAQPGVARELVNFEVDSDGGYRRINGFNVYGGESAVRPEAGNTIHGVFPYALGVVVCVGTSIYYSENGINWTQINYDTGHVGVIESNLSLQTELDRPQQGQAQFVLMRAPTGHTNSQYGALTIATAGGDKVAHFHIDGTGAGRLFIYEELSTPAAGQYVEEHDKHLCIVDPVNSPSTVYYSKTNDDRDFTGTGSGAVSISDEILGIKSFRDNLYIFCENTIHRLENINDPATLRVVQVTNNIGCLSGYSIQEIGGDLLFLAPDGIRTIAGTERIGDVELSSVSRQIQKITKTIAASLSSYIISSIVIRNKSQYRLFYSLENAESSTCKGIIGSLTSNGFEWSETLGIQALSISSSFDSNKIERYFHGDKDGYIYYHDQGNYFTPAGTPANIRAVYLTPDFDFGDVGTRKTIKNIRVSLSPEGEIRPSVRIRYDYDDVNIAQPQDYVLNSIPLPAIFGTALFNFAIFGGTNDPMVRQAVEGTGNTCSFKIFSDDQNAPYAINGLYIDYMPTGRR
jgi:hypothetical protein